MEKHYNYTCPHCSRECAVDEKATGQNVVCPHCSQEFFATAPDHYSEVIVPEKLPFFKSGRKKLLGDRMQELIADGEMSELDQDILTKTALLYGLNTSDLEEIAKRGFFEEFKPIQRRIEAAFVLTDTDLEEIEALKRKYGIKHFSLEGTAQLFRQIYLLKAKGELPPPLNVGLMLEQDEHVYYSLSSTWHQHRTRQGSASITPLANGTLYVTTSRLVFQGDSRNTKVEIKKIIDATSYSDSLKVEKGTGKPDFFTMNAAQATYVTALIGVLRTAAPTRKLGSAGAKHEKPPPLTSRLVDSAENPAAGSWRNHSATELQKEKMRFFGCDWNANITKGEASDAIDYCVRNFPEKEREWQSRPATAEQIKRLEEYGEEADPEMTYADAKEAIGDLAHEEEQRETERFLDDSRVVDAHEEMNDGFWDVYYRPVTLEEVTAAVTFLKEKQTSWSITDVPDALQALLPDYRFNEALRGIAVRYCLPCRGRIDIPTEQLGRTITCPHCGNTQTFS
jgi:DNA-directed RNA polymerase subunit RPC12/RpoP